VERPKLAVSTVTAVALSRPAVVVQGVPGSTSVVSGLAPGAVRAFLPAAAIRVSSATAVPYVRLVAESCKLQTTIWSAVKLK
jgi:hypothetical protein